MDAEPAPVLPPMHGGWLCLDFTNTVEPRHDPVERDYLQGYRDVVAWARSAGTLGPAAAERLLREAAGRPRAAKAHFAGAIELREVIFRVFDAVADGRTSAPADLKALQAAYADAMRHARLERRDDTFAWTWTDDHLDRPWWPVAVSAVELLTAGPIERVKRCPPDHGGCSWLFLDTTKNRSRRWCTMKDCGSAVKAQRQTARRRAARSSG